MQNAILQAYTDILSKRIGYCNSFGRFANKKSRRDRICGSWLTFLGIKGLVPLALRRRVSPGLLLYIASISHKQMEMQVEFSRPLGKNVEKLRNCEYFGLTKNAPVCYDVKNISANPLRGGDAKLKGLRIYSVSQLPCCGERAASAPGIFCFFPRFERCHNHRLNNKSYPARKPGAQSQSLTFPNPWAILIRDGILTGSGDGEYSFNRARWEYDLFSESRPLYSGNTAVGCRAQQWTGLCP